MPTVSIIIPNYNHAQYLKQRIDSILNQTYQDFEIIILDDKSTDNSTEIIEQYRDNANVAHIIYNETNSGSTFKQWKKGIELSIGEYIWIAESDDWCEPTLLETLIDGLLANDRCVLAYVRSLIVYDNGAEINIINHQESLCEYLEGTDFISRRLSKRNDIINASMAIFKKQCFYKVSNRFTEFKYCGDWLFWIEIARQGKVFISGKVLNYFRKHKDDVTSKMYASGNNIIETTKILEILHSDHYITMKEYKKILSIYYVFFQNSASTLSKQRKKEIEKRFFELCNKSFRYFLIYSAIFFKIKLGIKKQLNHWVH